MQLIWKIKAYCYSVWICKNLVGIHGHEIILLFSSSAKVWKHLYKIGEKESEWKRKGGRKRGNMYVRVPRVTRFTCNKQLIATERPRRMVSCAVPAYLPYATRNSLTIFPYNSKIKLRIKFWQKKNCLRIMSQNYVPSKREWIEINWNRFRFSEILIHKC